MRRLRGVFETCSSVRRGRVRRGPVALVVLVVAVGALGLTACVADPPPIIGTATSGDTQAVVTWQPPLATPTPITAYVVTPWIGFTRETPVVFNSSATTQTVTGLTNGVTYAFTVHAVNAKGDASAESGMSNPITPTTSRALFGWGDNHTGQLGDGSLPQRLTPNQDGTGTDWASTAAGEYFTAAVKTDGTMWAWGRNNLGQLGDGTTTEHSSPVQVGTATNWASVSAGPGYAVAVKTDGTLWAWGSGFLGNGTTNQSSVPVQAGTATDWASVAAGELHGVAVKTDGT